MFPILRPRRLPASRQSSWSRVGEAPFGAAALGNCETKFRVARLVTLLDAGGERLKCSVVGDLHIWKDDADVGVDEEGGERGSVRGSEDQNVRQPGPEEHAGEKVGCRMVDHEERTAAPSAQLCQQHAPDALSTWGHTWGGG